MDPFYNQRGVIRNWYISNTHVGKVFLPHYGPMVDLKEQRVDTCTACLWHVAQTGHSVDSPMACCWRDKEMLPGLYAPFSVT